MLASVASGHDSALGVRQTPIIQELQQSVEDIWMSLAMHKTTIQSLNAMHMLQGWFRLTWHMLIRFFQFQTGICSTDFCMPLLLHFVEKD